MTQTRDHGGNLDAAMHRYGGGRDDWLDLSTGINPVPYPVPDISMDAWAALPRKTDRARLLDAARSVYQTQAEVIPFAGAQGAIQAFPWLRRAGHARIVAPTYNEHAAALRTAGWAVQDVQSVEALAGADLAVVVNPNNPDGRAVGPETLIQSAQQVDLLIVDESFVDPDSHLSLGPFLADAPDNIIVLRSFGKFYGLAGVRLGFALASGGHAHLLSEIAGPWPVSGPAIEIAVTAFEDSSWQRATINRLRDDAARLDLLTAQAGWRLVGGTPLFRTYDTTDAVAAQEHLAQHRIWSRIFPYSPTWIRLGLPPQDRWAQLEAAFA